ncbi:hypothetical protein Hdeb2414_s0017g00511221 [Helianthus debilis subsp. tardiflorus]
MLLFLTNTCVLQKHKAIKEWFGIHSSCVRVREQGTRRMFYYSFGIPFRLDQ